MKAKELDSIYNAQEYFLLREASENRNKLINGNLIEISGTAEEYHKSAKTY